MDERAVEPPPVPLPEGDSEESFDVPAASVWRRSYLLEGHERIAWRLLVSGGYDIIFSSRVACSGLQKGGGRSKEVTERERGSDFEGFIDLGKEHADLLQSLGAAPAASGGYPTASGPDAAGPLPRSGPVLTLELDNFYSYFTGKRVTLRLAKTARLAAARPKTFREALEACEPHTRWEHALSLLGRMREVKLQPDLKTYNAALAVCRDSRQWEAALRLLDDMREAGVQPDAESYEIATTACELCGQADRALELVEHLDAAITGGDAAERAARRAAAAGDDDDVEFLRSMLRQGVSRCPAEARKLLGHLLSAQESLEEFAALRASGRGADGG